jgi:alcohol dehydrogenase class IV
MEAWLEKGFSWIPHPVKKVSFGLGKIGELAEIVKQDSRVVLVTSPSVVRSGLVDKAKNHLKSVAALETYEGVKPHSPMATVEDVRQLVKKIGATHVISIGGGSSIDTTKGVILDYLDSGNKPFHVAIPTTLSGGEYGKDVGLTDGNKKKIFSDVRVVPDLVILDPEAAVTAPLSIFMPSGMNAFAHCVEGLASVKGSAIGDALFLHSARLLFSSLFELAERPDDLVQRGRAQAGALMAACIGLGGIPKGIEHALAHVVGGRWKVPHAIAHAIMIAPCMRFNADTVGWAHQMIGETIGVPGIQKMAPQEASLAAADAVDGLLKRMKIPRRLSEVGVPRDDLENGAVDAFDDLYLHSNPKKITEASEVLGILEDAWGRPLSVAA